MVDMEKFDFIFIGFFLEKHTKFNKVKYARYFGSVGTRVYDKLITGLTSRWRLLSEFFLHKLWRVGLGGECEDMEVDLEREETEESMIDIKDSR
jgi:hypothetical protein